MDQFSLPRYIIIKKLNPWGMFSMLEHQSVPSVLYSQTHSTTILTQETSPLYNINFLLKE